MNNKHVAMYCNSLICYQQADTQTLLAVVAEVCDVHEYHISRAANR